MNAVRIAAVEPPFSTITGLNLKRLSIGKTLSRLSIPNSTPSDSVREEQFGVGVTMHRCRFLME